jgi:peroxiredoxin
MLCAAGEDAMKKVGLVAVMMTMWLTCLGWVTVVPGHCSGDPPAVGGMLPEVVLPLPQQAEDRAYLGIKSGDTFKIPQIVADVVIVEIFSMYCPYCQKEAPHVNELYSLIAQRPDLKNRIKIIGIGAGNSAFEVKVFKDKYQVPFPLFADEGFKIHKLVGEVRTPYFIGVETHPDGWHRVLYSRVGAIDDLQRFLDYLLKEAAGH